MKDKIVIQQVAEEQYQGHSTRRHLYVELEKMMGKPIISFFTSFRYPVMIEDSDADMIEGIFQKSDLSNGFALVFKFARWRRFGCRANNKYLSFI